MGSLRLRGATMTEGTIGWGILGAGRISSRFAAALAHVEGAQLVAIAGRTAAKLDAFADTYPVDKDHRYASADDGGATAYQALIDDPAVDAIYLALPHGLHAMWAQRALTAGKAVLSEKPAFLCEAEAVATERCAHEAGTFFMEAMKNRFCPLHDRVKSLLASGELGVVRAVATVQKLDYGENPPAYMLDAAQGGALLDMGCYAASWIEELTEGDDIEVASAKVRWHEARQADKYVDWADDIELTIGNVPVHFVCDGAAPYESRLTITCEQGSIEVERLHRPEQATVYYADGRIEKIDAPFEVDDFYGEIAHFCKLLRAGRMQSEVMPWAATVRIARMIDAMKAAPAD